MHRLESRRLIQTAIIVLALFVLGLAAREGWHGYDRYRAATRLVQVNDMADHLVVAGGVQAMERGVTSAALGAGAADDPAVRQRLAGLRRAGDQEWRAALAVARTLAAERPSDAAFAQALAEAERAHDVLARTRWRVDAGPAGVVRIEEWIDAVTGFIAANMRLCRASFALHNLPQDLSRLNVELRHSLWNIGEHAGLERGVLAYHVGVGRPVPAPQLDELKSIRGVTDHNFRSVLAFKVSPDSDPTLRKAIETMEHDFVTRFAPVRAAVYRAAATGNYPLGADEWIARATEAIDSILAVNATVSEGSKRQARAVARASLYQLAGDLALVAAALGLATFGLTRVRQTANALFRQKELAEVTLYSIGDAVITTDARARVEYLNPVAEEIIGWRTDEARGRPLSEIFRIVDGYTREPVVNPVEECLGDEHVVGIGDNTILVRRDGTEVVIDDSAAPIRDREGRVVGAVMVFYDITHQRGVPHLLSHQATHDALTGLTNRREFERRLGELFAGAKNQKQHHALCYLDLDQFKVINDTCGHGVGDRLLRQLTYLLKQHVRGSDTLARLGGDEFGVLLVACPLERALGIAEELRRVIGDFHFTWQGRRFVLGASVGVVPITSDSTTPARLLSEADSACYAAKEKGRNRVQVYQPGNLEFARRHGEMQWVSRINEALAADRFVLYSQPIAPLAAGRRRHCEILVRMLDEKGQPVLPMTFMPAAERYNQMPAIDRWVIANAFGMLGRGEHNRCDPCCAVYNINLSGASLCDEGLTDFVFEQLDATGVPPASVCFEITETVAVANFQQAAEFIGRMKAKGFWFALDDFGSGLSSFMYLKNLPVDFVKIDGSFVKDIAVEPADHAMVQSINHIGHVLGIQTVAEFAESETIVGQLRALGLDYAQGYAIARPGPLRDCASWCAFGREAAGSH